MDFLKTLLAYMALMSTLAVQEGPLPQDVPMPTPLPPSVTATAVPHQTAVPTATPTPTPDAVPVLTPDARYDTLQYNDRGNEVRKLQSRLIELGYMPQGSADGAYGYQTYNAVRDFQRANGLSADGVAGPATLTNLYQNPNVRAVVPETPVPTATPTPSLPPLPTPSEPAALPTPATQAAIPLPQATADAAVEAVPAVDLAHTLTEVPDALIISGNTGKALAIVQMVDGDAVLLPPVLWRNGLGEPVVALRDLVDCYEGWSLMGSSADGLFTLEAAGYTVILHFASDGVRVTSQGQLTSLNASDVRLENGQIFINGEFLEKTLNANVIFDVEERSLVLFIMDRSMYESND